MTLPLAKSEDDCYLLRCTHGSGVVGTQKQGFAAFSGARDVVNRASLR